MEGKKMSYVKYGTVTWVEGKNTLDSLTGNTASALGCVEYRANWPKTCVVHLISGKIFRKSLEKVTVAEDFSWALPPV